MSRRFNLYVVTSQDGRAYVGCTSQSVDARWLDHVRESHSRTQGPLYPGRLKTAIADLGARAFTVEHVATSADYKSAREAENLLMEQYGTMTPHGFNMKRSGYKVARDVIDVRYGRYPHWPPQSRAFERARPASTRRAAA